LLIKFQLKIERKNIIIIIVTTKVTQSVQVEVWSAS